MRAVYLEIHRDTDGEGVTEEKKYHVREAKIYFVKNHQTRSIFTISWRKSLADEISNVEEILLSSINNHGEDIASFSKFIYK